MSELHYAGEPTTAHQDDMTVVEHRAVAADGKVLQTAVMLDCERWLPSPEWPDECAYETRILPDGQWEPSAVVHQPGRPLIVITLWTI